MPGPGRARGVEVILPGSLSTSGANRKRLVPGQSARGPGAEDRGPGPARQPPPRLAGFGVLGGLAAASAAASLLTSHHPLARPRAGGGRNRKGLLEAQAALPA